MVTVMSEEGEAFTMRATSDRLGDAPEPPHSRLHVSDTDRDQVVEHVKAAFAEGRLDKDEMDERLDLAMNARTHGDLAPIMRDLCGAPASRPRPAPAPHHRHGATPVVGERIGAAFAHVLFLAGPLIMLLTGGRTSRYIRVHAVEALNFDLTLLGATILLPFTIIGVPLIPLMWIAAVLLSFVGGIAALTDGGFRYPLTLSLIR